MNTEQVEALTVWATTSLPRSRFTLYGSYQSPIERLGSEIHKSMAGKMPGITPGFAEAPINFLRVRKEGGRAARFGQRQIPRGFAREFSPP